MLRGRSGWVGVWTVLLAMAFPGLVGAARVELVSRASPVPDSFGTSGLQAVSADGRYVAFLSTAPNLAPGQVDDNNGYDVFLHDRVEGTTTLVSHAAGSPARATRLDGPISSQSLGISADGRYVAFDSVGTDLVPGVTDANHRIDVFLWDRVTDTATLISHAAGAAGTPADEGSFGVRISADGNFVAFTSFARNLVAGQSEAGSNLTTDVFLWSRATGTSVLVSRASGVVGTVAAVADGPSAAAGISADGNVVVFTSEARDLLAGVADPKGTFDVYAYQRSSGTLTLVSRVAGAPQVAAGAAPELAAVSADGNVVAFLSVATNLVTGQMDSAIPSFDAFLFDRTTGEMRLASHTIVSTRMAGGVSASSRFALSANGRYLAFASRAVNLVSAQVDTNLGEDVFVYDRVTEAVSLASHGSDSPSMAGLLNLAPSVPIAAVWMSFSADGRYLAFDSLAVDLVPGQADAPGTFDVFLYDQSSQGVSLVSRGHDSASIAGNGRSDFPVLSADGGVVSFTSQASDLGEGQADPNGLRDVFLYSRTSGEITNASRRDPGLPPRTPFQASVLGGLSADGRTVAFQSAPEGQPDAFLRDIAAGTAGTTVRLSPPPSPPFLQEASFKPAVSADGRFAAFVSREYNPGAPDSIQRLYLYDRVAGTLSLVNRSPGSAMQAEGNPMELALSADGRSLAYECERCVLVPGHVPVLVGTEIFLYDRLTGSNTLLSHASGLPGVQANQASYGPKISANGRFVAYIGLATNLVAGQGDGGVSPDLFITDTATGETVLVSHAAGSPTAATGQTYAATAALSADGRFLAFQSDAANLVPGQVDAAGSTDVFLYDRVAGTTVLMSHAASSPVTAGSRPAPSTVPESAISMTPDGRFVVYDSPASNLVAGVTDTNGGSDVFLYDRLTGTNALVSHAAGAPLKAGNGPSATPGLSADGSRIAFLSAATDLVPGTVPARSRNLYVQDRTTGARTFIARAAPQSEPLPPFSFVPRLSIDGRRIAFLSDAPLVAGDYNGTSDVYLWTQDAVTVPACTLLDTRRRADRPALSSNVQRTVTVRGACGVPATAKQVLVKVTVFNPSGKGNLRFYPGAVADPPSGILRFDRGATRTASFTLPLSSNGKLTILPFVAGKGTVHVAMEVNGYEN